MLTVGVLLAIAENWMGVQLAVVGILFALMRPDLWRGAMVITVASALATSSQYENLSTLGATLRPAALLVLCLASWVFPSHRMRSASPFGGVKPLFIGLYGITMLAVMSSFWSEARGSTIQWAAMLFVLVAALHGAARSRWGDRETVLNDARSLFIALLVPSLISLWLFVLAAPSAWGVEQRFQGVFANPNQLGLLGSLSCALALLLFSLSSSLWYIVLSLLPGMLVFLSGSRSAMISVIAGIVLILFLEWRRFAIRFISLAIVPVALWLVFVPSQSWNLVVQAVPGLQRATADGGDGASLNGRTEIWQNVVGLIVERPLGGYGFGTTSQLLTGHTSVATVGTATGNTHNAFIQLTLEIGIPGALALGIALLGAGMAVRRLPQARVRHGMLIFIVMCLIPQLAEATLVWPSHYFAIAFWLTVVSVSVSFAEPADVWASAEPVLIRQGVRSRERVAPLRHRGGCAVGDGAAQVEGP